MRVAVLGAGAWGTALAKLLHDAGHSVVIWGHNRERLEEIARTRRNERHLPGIELPADWTLEPDIHRAVAGAEAIIDFASVSARLKPCPCYKTGLKRGFVTACGDRRCDFTRTVRSAGQRAFAVCCAIFAISLNVALSSAGLWMTMRRPMPRSMAAMGRRLSRPQRRRVPPCSLSVATR